MNQIDINYVNNFTGYKNNKDITALLPTDITAGSKNVFIEEGAKLSVRGGTRFLGAEGQGIPESFDEYWTLPNRIHSKYDIFTNATGQVIPIRVFYSGDSAVGDIFEAYLPVYDAGVDTGEKQWYQLSQSNSLSTPFTSRHELFFAEWWDNISLKPLLIFVGGTSFIRSWTGAYGVVTGVTGTTVTIDGTFASRGFLNNANGGSDSVVVNGVSYNASGNYTTNTITVASTAGISVNDLVFQNIKSVDKNSGGNDFQFDVCAMLNNQVYYLDWRQRNVYLSWNRNQIAKLGVTSYVGTSGLDDALFSGTYTGTTYDTYRVSIDSTDPDLESLTYSSTGVNGRNDFIIDTSGFTEDDGDTYTYVFKIVSDFFLQYTGTANSFQNGELIYGQTSGATAIVVGYDMSNVGAFCKNLVGTFQIGETVVGSLTGDTVTFDGISYANNLYSYSKNGATIFSNSITNGGIVAQNDGLDWGWGLNATTGGYHVVGDTWTLVIRKGGVDTFSWSVNGETKGQRVAITGGNQTLQNGVRVNFEELSGHNQGDTWTMIAQPKIQDGYSNFNFSAPLRFSGEGFKLSLDTNGWTMSPQEKSMYINGSGGEWYRVTLELSADLLTETPFIERLKTEPKNKVIYPTLIGYMKNYLTIVSNDKTFDILGRQEFLELPQAKSLSEEVKRDFITANWTNGTLNYQDRKMFFVIPRENKVIVYDEVEKYYHAPMTFPRAISSISFIDGKICGHSNERNETYELFTEEQDDYGFPIQSQIVMSYYDYSTEKTGMRFKRKTSSAIAIDGYMDGNPDINWKLNFDVGGCDGIITGIINPQICQPIDLASLGKSGLGYHGLGNAPVNVINHFKYGQTFSPQSFYLRNIEFSCLSPKQRWSITSVGINVIDKDVSNNDLFNITN